MKKFAFLLALVAVCLFAQTAAANLVANGSFETGNFNGWTVSPEIREGVNWVFHSDIAPPGTEWAAQSGLYAAYHYGSTWSTFSQDLTTTAGQYYNLQFWLWTGALTSGTNEFMVTWGGTTVFDQTNLPASNIYDNYNYTLLASAGTTTLTFGFRHDSAYFHLDSVSVDPVPLPPTMLLLGCGLFSLLAWRRGRKS